MSDFPDWKGHEPFITNYRKAVRTRSRWHKRRMVFPPVVLRTGPEEGADALSALRGALRRPAYAGGTVSCTPYAFIQGHTGTTTELIADIAEGLVENAPLEAGRLRLPAYELVSSLAGTEDTREERAWNAHRARRGSARTADTTAPAEGGTFNTPFFTIPVKSVTSLLARVHRKGWEARWGLRLRQRRYTHLWPTSFNGKHSYGDALVEFDRVREHGSSRDWDKLLLTALMTDLFGYARQGFLHPGRRRRRPRHVLLLNGSGNATGAELSGADTAGAAAIDDFVNLYQEIQNTGTRPVAVLVATLPPVPGVPPDDNAMATAATAMNPARIAGRARTDPRTVRTDVTPALATSPAPVPVPRIWTPFARGLRPGTELILETTALLVALWLYGLLAFIPPIGKGPFTDDYTGCLTGSTYVKSGKVNGEAETQYADALTRIEEQNKFAEPKGGREPLGQADPKRTVTIAHVRSALAENENERRSGGSIPELRGLSLSAEALHLDAPANDDDVWVKIKTYDAGVQFADAAKAARQIIADAKKDPHLIGVTGFTESRVSTVNALRLLNAAEIPIVTSTATAKAMEVGRYYHGAAPSNKREATVVTKFIEEANTIDTGEDTCAQAERVVVVTDPTDVYSDELGKALNSRLPLPKGERIGYTPGQAPGAPVPTAADLDMRFSMTEVAAGVCDRVTANSKTLVYWTSRVREFDTFLNAFQRGACANKSLTVVGGNELTNAAFSGNYKEKAWLRLYHTAHMLPAGHPDRSATTVEFSNSYRKAFGADDLWLNDGHAALAYDSVQILAKAAGLASAASTDLTRPNIQQNINNNTFSAEGASGLLEFRAGSLHRPYNKLLVMLHHDTRGSAPVLVCGNPGANIAAGTSWRQGDRSYACPNDNAQ